MGVYVSSVSKCNATVYAHVSGMHFFQMHTNAPQQIFNYVSRTCLFYTGMLLLLLSSTRTKLLIFAGKSTSVERKLNLMPLRLHLSCDKER